MRMAFSLGNTLLGLNLQLQRKRARAGSEFVWLYQTGFDPDKKAEVCTVLEVAL